MFKNNKSNLFFLNLIFNKNENSFFVNPLSGHNCQTITTSNKKMLKSFKSLLELKPNVLYDIVSYDSTFLSKFKKHTNNDVTTIYYFYSYGAKSYVNVIITKDNKEKLMSLSTTYKSASWLEREQKEFFGVKFAGLKDVRNLFLEYDWNKNIYLKRYNVSDNHDILYDPENDDHLMFSKLKPTTL